MEFEGVEGRVEVMTELEAEVVLFLLDFLPKSLKRIDIFMRV